MKSLCVDSKSLIQQKVWKYNLLVLSICPWGITAYQLCVHCVTISWSTFSAWWQIRNGWTTCHCRNAAETATGYEWHTEQSPNLAALRAGVDSCVFFRLITSCWIVSPVQSSHTHSGVKVIVRDNFWKMAPDSTQQDWGNVATCGKLMFHFPHTQQGLIQVVILF